MALILTIENETSLPNGAPVSMRLTDKRNLDIGRGAHLDWPLPDPTRFISGKHCEVRYRDDGYWLYDVSTNGTFLNDSPRRLQAPYRLCNGDRLIIGSYVILVTVEGEEDKGGVPAIGSAGLPSHSLATGTPASSTPFSPPSFTPAFSRATAPVEAAPPQAQDYVGGAAAEAARSEAKPHYEDVESGEARDIEQGAAFSVEQDAAVPVGHDGFVAADEAHGQAPVSSVQGPEHERAPASERVAVDAPALPATRDMPQPGADYAPAGASAPQHDAPAADVAPHVNVVKFPGLGGGAQVPGAAPEAAPSKTDYDEFIRRFAAGAGIPEHVFARRDQLEVAEELGQLTRLVAENLKQLLSARYEAKRFTRAASQTMIQALDNNPLKFAPTTEDALRIMLGPRTRSYLDARRSFEGAFDDLKTHQIKTFSAMQGAVKMLVEDFDPQQIDAAAGPSSGIGAWLTSRKARLWDLFVARWQAKSLRHKDGLVDAFMLYFSECYDRASDKS